MEVRLEKSRKELLKDEFDKPYFGELAKFVKDEYKNDTVYPPPPPVRKCFCWLALCEGSPADFKRKRGCQKTVCAFNGKNFESP